MGERVKPLGVIYYSAGELHGMRNVGTAPATYRVFELHTPAAVAHRQRHAKILRAKSTERQQREAEKQRRTAEKERRKRGIRGLLRKLVKAAKKLVR